MYVEKPNFSATIYFTIGIKRSVAITRIEEHWLISSNESCDVFENDLEDEGAAGVLECVGVNLETEGMFVVDVLGVAKEDESPDYEIIRLETMIK